MLNGPCICEFNANNSKREIEITKYVNKTAHMISNELEAQSHWRRLERLNL